MRYQEPIYIQSEPSAVRNRHMFNVNMSSDICIFERPEFSLRGASKLDCITTATTYEVSTATTIPLVFQFTENVFSLVSTHATFKYEVYKYNDKVNRFNLPALYSSGDFPYSVYSDTFLISDNIPISNLALDGEYLVKGYFKFSACTEFMNQLGRTIDTSIYNKGTEYDLYNPELDYYFIAFKAADIPQFFDSGSGNLPSGTLTQQTILLADEQTSFVLPNNYNGAAIITLNGLTLSSGNDFTLSGNVATLVAPAVSGDILTVIYTTNNYTKLVGENFIIRTSIISGTTDNQGSNKTYFNTTTGKYEVFLDYTPSGLSNIILMINGATLANGVDFYQSSSNVKRLILEGDLMVNDVLTIVYFPNFSVLGNLNVSNPVVHWQITNPPQTTIGQFTLEVSTNPDFTPILTTSSQNYVIGVINYSDTFTVSGKIGDKIYYRVKNEKTFVNLCGFSATSINYSEVVPITVATNSINKY